jgi:hypothetical protein
VANGVNETAFFRYVERTSASALASRPVPLDFLIRCFRRGDLPETQVELYQRGCLSLCEEAEHRIETGLQPALSAAERLAVAKRIAACTIFSTRPALLFGRDDLDVAADAIRLSELAGGQERVGMSVVEVTEKTLRDALDTGLFTSRGAKVLGWAHHTYEEYLAARYLSDSGLTPEQILPLVVHPDDPDRKLTPQLHGVAAWLAVLHPEVLAHVIEHEPELLLFSDVVIERDDDRARLIDELLRRKRAQQLARIDVLAYPRFRKLAHAQIGRQLRSVLMNNEEPDELRRLAADIAEYTECSILIPELTQIALDPTEAVEVRTDAAGAVARIGDQAERAALKPLLEGPSDSRQERWLIRLALKAAWPHALSADDLFGYLGPNRRRLGTVGDDFTLVQHIRETLTTEHLGSALQWVLGRVRALPEGPTIKLGDALQRLEDAIVVRAWRSDNEHVATALAEVAVEKIRRYEPFVARDDLDDEDVSDHALMSDVMRRRRFASFLLPALAASANPISTWLLFEKTQYLQAEDLPWLIDRQMTIPRRPEEWSFEAHALLRLADLTNPSTFDALWKAAKHNPALAERMTGISAAVPLTSEEAKQARAYYAATSSAARAKRRATAPKRQPDSATRIAQWLNVLDKQPCAYWRLIDEMARSTDAYANSMNLDVDTFPGWMAADGDTRHKTIVAAERFLRECNPDADSWFGTQQFALSAMGGVRALTLLKTAAPERFALVDADVWKKWTPALLGIPNNDSTVPLLAHAYRHAPDEVVRRLQQHVRANEAYVAHKLSDILDDTIVGALIAVAREEAMPDESLTRLLEPLLHNRDARLFAEEFVRETLRDGERNRAAAVAATLLLDVPNESWDAIWPLIATDAAFGRAVIELAVNRDHFQAAPVYTLDEARVADLYLWLTCEYPPEHDPGREGVYTPDTRDKISSWRSRCLDSLKRRGTRGACDALRRLATAKPEQTYLWPLVVEAESKRREKSWQPTSVATLRELLRDRTRRQVRSDTELAEVVIESLRRLQQRLQSETPAAFDLWNTSPFKPKSENEVSSYIARFLRDDLAERGVIIAREVEIRASASQGSGERTDIHVDVSVDIDRHVQRFSVIVEVKGCWNRGVHGDMTGQLARRYLRDNTSVTGIFLVGWFHCPTWESSDYRKRACSKEVTAVASALESEAATLRGEGFDIRPFVLDCSLR